MTAHDKRPPGEDELRARLSDEQFQAMLDIHTVVPFRMARAVAPHMREPAKAERDAASEFVEHKRQMFLQRELEWVRQGPRAQRSSWPRSKAVRR